MVFTTFPFPFYVSSIYRFGYTRFAARKAQESQFQNNVILDGAVNNVLPLYNLGERSKCQKTIHHVRIAPVGTYIKLID